MTDSLKILAGPDGSSKLLQSINNKTGNYKSYTIADYYIKNEAGSNDVISYNYKLKVTYENGTIDEVIGLKKYGSAIQLNYYNANTDLLMK